jgi:hypothetical protein
MALTVTLFFGLSFHSLAYQETKGEVNSKPSGTATLRQKHNSFRLQSLYLGSGGEATIPDLSKVTFFKDEESFSGLAQTQDRSFYIPDRKLTPGATIDVSLADLCKPRYRSPNRKIPVALKSQVLDRYGISRVTTGYNIDHLIPVSLGGSNSISNLWPQPLASHWNYYMKNKLEHKLRRMVCSGDIELKRAQQEIAMDWVSAFRKYIGEPERSPSSAEK